MARQPIPVTDLLVKAHSLWAEQWLLLTSGDYTAGHFNTMTVSAGSLGTIWGKPFAQVVVRPVRYTFEFMERYPSFTLCVLPETYRSSLELLGSKSGRHTDKIAEAGLTPVPSTQVAAPGFAEAHLILECQKIYWDDLAPSHFLAPDLEQNYPKKDYHRIYYGQVVAITGEASYTVPPAP